MIALFSLLTFLFTGQAGAQGYIWCLGEDGHSALEYAASDTCGPSPQQLEQTQQCHGEEIRETSAQEEHCGPCYDLPTTFEAASRRTQDRKDFTAQIEFPATIQVASLPTFARTLTSNLYPQPPPRISQAILAHRTVVLLN